MNLPVHEQRNRSKPTAETLAIEERVKASSQALSAFPREGPLGLIPDKVKLTHEYRSAKAEFAAAFAALRAHNAARLLALRP
jgi:hypothetical protein